MKIPFWLQRLLGRSGEPDTEAVRRAWLAALPVGAEAVVVAPSGQPLQLAVVERIHAGKVYVSGIESGFSQRPAHGSRKFGCNAEGARLERPTAMLRLTLHEPAWREPVHEFAGQGVGPTNTEEVPEAFPTEETPDRRAMRRALAVLRLAPTSPENEAARAILADALEL